MQESVLLKLRPTRLAFLKIYTAALALTALWSILFFNPFDLNLSFLRPYRTHTLALVGGSIILGAFSELKVLTEYYILTTYRIKKKAGILSIRESSVPWDRISDISMYQNVLDRILGIGSIHIESTGGGTSPEITLQKIRSVKNVKVMIEEEMFQWKTRSYPESRRSEQKNDDLSNEETSYNAHEDTERSATERRSYENNYEESKGFVTKTKNSIVNKVRRVVRKIRR